jgi:arylsulfatase A-like enzyme
MLESLERFLRDERDPARPFLLFAYFWDPHYDYLPPAPCDAMFVRPGDVRVDLRGYGRFPTVGAQSPPGVLSYVRSQYAGEIRCTDAALGRLFQRLREAGLWDETLVVVTADHGEEFFEHGSKGHKNNLYVESLHVPLVVKLPGSRARGRDARLASLVDVFPTVLEVTGTAAPAGLDGRSLLHPAPAPDRAIFFELHSAWYFQGPDGKERSEAAEWHGVRQGALKLVGIPGRRMVLFDVFADPGERTDLMGRDAKTERAARSLEIRLAEHRRAMERTASRFEVPGDAPRTAELDARELERLRVLGYVK